MKESLSMSQIPCPRLKSAPPALRRRSEIPERVQVQRCPVSLQESITPLSEGARLQAGYTASRMVFITQILCSCFDVLRLATRTIVGFHFDFTNATTAGSHRIDTGYWHRTPREGMNSFSYRPQIVIIRRSTQCELTAGLHFNEFVTFILAKIRALYPKLGRN